MMNQDDLIVLSGRISLAPHLDESTKRPAILPSSHHMTKLYLQHLHEKYGHQGIETVMNAARQKFWIIDGRSAVKSVFSKCQKCRLRKAKPLIPIMGQIPKIRLTPTLKPFTFTGVDYFGPIYVTVRRRTEKRWGVLFTCLSVRAVHMEVAHSLTTDSTLMAI